ncbi:THAP domain-containing protein 1-like [Drosophila grimshawi]|uniref:THAP domain-containing protein 1-like n=1 Tax=Drosophila grimshawi TaxID=7222 RepID=UPI000C8702BA|nr:THAP domain-containing protein 1-like [Drosophila grimshawi]
MRDVTTQPNIRLLFTFLKCAKMKCSVVNCQYRRNVDGKVVSFFSLPKNEKLAKEWLQFCDNPKLKNTRYAFVCSNHFMSDDIIGRKAFEMGLSKKMRLKPGAVPRFQIGLETEETKNRQSIVEQRNNKRLVNDLLANSNANADNKAELQHHEDTVEEASSGMVDFLDVESSGAVIDELNNQIKILQQKNLRLTVNFQLAQKKYKDDVKHLHKQLFQAKSKILLLERQIEEDSK